MNSSLDLERLHPEEKKIVDLFKSSVSPVKVGCVFFFCLVFMLLNFKGVFISVFMFTRTGRRGSVITVDSFESRLPVFEDGLECLRPLP